MTPIDTATETRLQRSQRSRRRWLLLAIIPVLAVAWWLGSPLFLDDEVNEAFPLASTTTTVAEVETPATAASEPALTDGEPTETTRASTTTTASTEPVVLLAGAFEGLDAVHRGSGSATVYEVDGSTVIRFEDFDVTNGPDLRVNLVLSDGSMVDLGALKGNVGDQNYDIPTDVDLASVESVLIYCRAFSVPFAEALLSR